MPRSESKIIQNCESKPKKAPENKNNQAATQNRKSLYRLIPIQGQTRPTQARPDQTRLLNLHRSSSVKPAPEPSPCVETKSIIRCLIHTIHRWQYIAMRVHFRENGRFIVANRDALADYRFVRIPDQSLALRQGVDHDLCRNRARRHTLAVVDIAVWAITP
jgi:hypothetical protein